VAAGDTLSRIDATTEALAAHLYVLSVSVDAVTALNSYMGSTATAVNALDAAFFELNALRPEFFLWNQIETIIAGLLWPEVYAYNTYNITPDLSDYQVSLNANVEDIERAVQVIGGTTYNVAFQLYKNMDPDIFSTGVMAELFAFDASTVYVTVRERVTAATTNESYIQCIATGAAALAAGSTLGGAALESSKKDSQERARMTPRQAMWQDFLMLRQQIANDLAAEVDWFQAVR